MSKKPRELSYNPKKRPYGDIEPSLVYLSKKKRDRNTLIKRVLVMSIIVACIIFFIIRFALVTKCASANGFYERYNCGHDKCCFTEPYHDPNKAWQD